jgi:hypothetical protein
MEQGTGELGRDLQIRRPLECRASISRVQVATMVGINLFDLT